jgi:hypothetical protein
MARDIVIRKTSQREAETEDDLRGKTPNELLAMVWPLTLNVWAFKERLNDEPRLQRHVVVLTRRSR